jgi:regulatory protein
MNDHSVDARPAATKRKGPRPVSPAGLEKKALHYLERFASSAANLRLVLMRSVDRSVRAHGTDREAASSWVDALIARLVAKGLLNDAIYAEGRAVSLRRQGRSTRAIQARLAAKGVPAAQIADALAGEDGAGPEAEFDAALTFARKRRLGPYRQKDRALRRDRDLAALARAGFSLALARRIVDADQPPDFAAKFDGGFDGGVDDGLDD